ncbi:MAG: hypothetical protein ABSH05_26660 [Bryobacteraceae bacterium]|jgi:hypothetical protein
MRLRQALQASDGPYTYKVVTAVLKPKADSLKAEWLVKNTDRLERGLLVIVDGNEPVSLEMLAADAAGRFNERGRPW